MPRVQCEVCKKEFYAKPNHLKLGWGKCCSYACRNQFSRKGKLVRCTTCNKEVYKSPFHLRHSQSKKYFCCKSCQTVWRNGLYLGKDHENWVDGAKSYRDILKRNGVRPECNLCKTANPLLLAVHHVDKNRHNNDISNLTWLCHNCHYLVHHEAESGIKILVISNSK